MFFHASVPHSFADALDGPPAVWSNQTDSPCVQWNLRCCSEFQNRKGRQRWKRLDEWIWFFGWSNHINQMWVWVSNLRVRLGKVTSYDFGTLFGTTSLVHCGNSSYMFEQSKFHSGIGTWDKLYLRRRWEIIKPVFSAWTFVIFAPASASNLTEKRPVI